MDTMQMDKNHIAPTYRRFPVTIVSGKGALLRDEKGKEYIDLGSGIAVNIFGAGDDEWKSAVTEQLNRIQHTSNLYYTRPQAELAQILCEKTGMARVFFGNSGAEANECGIKAARKWNSDRLGKDARSDIITLCQSFHGRTMATISATGQDAFHQHFGPFLPGFTHTPPNDIAAMERALSNPSVGAVLMEMILGEGGVLALEKDFVRETARLCKEKGLLLMVDEVQTGNGRTGTLYAYEQFGIRPDVITTAKGLGGGLPIGCCLLGEKLKDTLSPGSHGSTFGGNPVCAAGALNIIRRIDQPLLDGVKRKHALIVRLLEGAKGVRSVSGMGLMLGIETEKPAAEVVSACLERGVLMLTAKDKLRLLPPLTIEDEQIEKAMALLKEVLAQ